MVDVLAQHSQASLDMEQIPPPVDMQKLFFAYTMDSISKIFFGRDTNTMAGKKDELAESFDNAHRFMLQFMYENVAVSMGSFLPVTSPTHTHMYTTITITITHTRSRPRFIIKAYLIQFLPFY